MLKALSSAVSSIAGTPVPKHLPSHRGQSRAESYTQLAKELDEAGVPVDISDCAACDHPCPISTETNGHAGSVVDVGRIWDGKEYEQYVLDKYGDLGDLPDGFEQDWDSNLAGSGGPPQGRVVIISTGKSDWERDHTVSPFFCRNLIR